MKNTIKWLIVYTVAFYLFAVPVTIHAEELPTIQKIHITNDNSNVQITWSMVDGCEKYEVRVLDSLQGQIEVTISENIAVFIADPEESYQINVIAWIGDQCVAESSTIEIKIPATIHKIATTKRSKKCVYLAWSEDSNANYYEIRRKKKESKDYKILKVTKKNDFYDKKIKDDQTYVYKIVPIYQPDDSILIYGEAKTYTFKNTEIVDTSNARYTYEEYEADVKQLQMKYSQYCTTSVIGKTADNRKLYKVEIGNQDAKKHLFVVANLHAREYMTSLLCMKQMEYYLENYNKSIAGGKPVDLLKKMSIVYIPMANPDGTTIAQEGIEGIRSKKLREKLYSMMGKTKPKNWKANVNGVDLNRNFKVGFEKIKSKKAGPMGFPGSNILSENETKAITKIMNTYSKNKHKIVAIVNYHAAGKVIFRGCATSVNKNTCLVTKRMYSCAHKVTGYRNADTIYTDDTASGDFRSYHMRSLNIPGITIEIGKKKTPVPYSEFAAVWKKNKTLIMEEVKMLCDLGKL